MFKAKIRGLKMDMLVCLIGVSVSPTFVWIYVEKYCEESFDEYASLPSFSLEQFSISIHSERTHIVCFILIPSVPPFKTRMHTYVYLQFLFE